jgi:hypothetical protein
MSAYRLHLLQALKEVDKMKRLNLCCRIMSHIENDDEFLNRLTFSDKNMFHVRGEVNRHNVCMWGTETPHVGTEHEKDLHKVIVFCAISRTRVFGPLFFCGEHSDRDHVSGHGDGVAFPTASGRLRRLHFAAGWSPASLSPRGPQVPQ